MTFARQAKLFLTFGSLVASTLALPWSQKPLGNDEDDDTPLPVVVWHGLGDHYAADGLKEVGHLIEAANPGTLVYFIRMDESASQDRTATFFGNLTEQVQKACDDIAAHPILSTAPAIDALGFSQGGQFLRAYHNGIIDFKACGATDFLCKGAMSLLRGNTFSQFVQSRLVPAQYFRDPAANFDRYLEASNFLADINNERVLKNETYRDNIIKLVNFAMYIFEEDTTVIPKETAWFEEVNGTEVIPLRARDLYREDWIGLRELDRKGGLKFRTAPGEHMRLSGELLVEAFGEFFGPFGKKFADSEREDEL
ncbi:palmitoyl-protein thioesterase 1 [Magnaporthiopsis poae ATCC 64411]|uniref:Palmitoyl-protein thioesterase 1 n=1 Tax=Magnaporthiopsis poae (strain ATCC 64411 / 73-15) TaxID=644358 RepID=A0A0C4EAB9_MAGP6|nr:palmitoyl-protein thioesterase 1 [Magnaporthiopsis poae ATCC 64411]